MSRSMSLDDDEVSKSLSFLLRLWQVKDGGKRVWRFSLVDPFTENRKGFASLGELLNYLLEEIYEDLAGPSE